MTKHLLLISTTVILLVSANFADAQLASAETSPLVKSFDLATKPGSSAQFFVMESRLILHASDGKRVGTDIYRLRLKCDPAPPGKEGDQYICARFTWQPHGGPETAIPGLTNFAYVFRPAGGKDGQMFGIDRGKFEGLADSAGKPLPADKAFHVYNAFIDFHSFCDVFGQRTSRGRGIQDLKKIGDKIVHASAFSEPAVGPGSVFKNGEITLEFKGLSLVNGQSCALIGYDSGQSSFKMMTTSGSSHYFGDIYKDLASGWVQRATMTEVVVSETTLPAPPHKFNAVIERLIEICNVSEKEFGL
jgi:hypothetical protein